MLVIEIKMKQTRRCQAGIFMCPAQLVKYVP